VIYRVMDGKVFVYLIVDGRRDMQIFADAKAGSSLDIGIAMHPGIGKQRIVVGRMAAWTLVVTAYLLTAGPKSIGIFMKKNWEDDTR
jgi:hypothetical protein